MSFQSKLQFANHSIHVDDDDVVVGALNVEREPVALETADGWMSCWQDLAHEGMIADADVAAAMVLMDVRRSRLYVYELWCRGWHSQQATETSDAQQQKDWHAEHR